MFTSSNISQDILFSKVIRLNKGGTTEEPRFDSQEWGGESLLF
jgi:hypothetical protein